MALVEHSVRSIDLLLIDVILPEMNGRELARQLKNLAPAMQTVFMSGYTANVIVQHGVLEDGVHFLQKPFSAVDLCKTIRRILA